MFVIVLNNLDPICFTRTQESRLPIRAPTLAEEPIHDCYISKEIITSKVPDRWECSSWPGEQDPHGEEPQHWQVLSLETVSPTLLAFQPLKIKIDQMIIFKTS